MESALWWGPDYILVSPVQCFISLQWRWLQLSYRFIMYVSYQELSCIRSYQSELQDAYAEMFVPHSIRICAICWTVRLVPTYRIGAKHPLMYGQPAKLGWGELWAGVKADADKVVRSMNLHKIWLPGSDLLVSSFMEVTLSTNTRIWWAPLCVVICWRDVDM